MKKKTRAYSISEEAFELVRKEALRRSNKQGKRVSESSVVDAILLKHLAKKQK